MFKEFYSFSEDPFTLEPDPRFFFLTESHKKILFSLMYGITEKRGFTLLLGEAGTGKTTLIRHLLSRLGPHIKAIPLFAPPKTFDELLEVILRELKLPWEEGKGNSRLWQLNEYLYQRSSQNETLLIIVDEAQNLSEEFLEQLRQLCNPDPIRPRFLQGFLVGKPNLADKLDSWDLRALKQRIVMRRQLGPLTEEESRRYIEHRLKAVGSSLEAIFTPEAAALICRHSQGIPRVIHRVCSLALSTGYVLTQEKIDAPFIKRILPLLHPQKPGVAQRMESLARIMIDRLPNIPRIMRISDALRREKKFKMLVENIPLKVYMKEGIALVQDGILKFGNPKLFEILGYTKEELTSKPFREFIFPKDREGVEIQRDKPANGGLNHTSSIRMIHKDGGLRWLENKETLVRWGKDKAVLHFLADRTYQKQAEEELSMSIEPFRRLIDTLDKHLIASNGNG